VVEATSRRFEGQRLFPGLLACSLHKIDPPDSASLRDTGINNGVGFRRTGMLFVLYAIDRENSLSLRNETRAAHLEYAKATGAIRLGGPVLDAAGNMAGSMIILELADMEAAKKWAADDPYAKAELFARSEIRAWKATVNPINAAL
jgi:uncharacterized protein YciI